MSFDTDTIAEPADDPITQDNQVEAPKAFIPTPERISQYLEMNIEEVHTEMKSVEGRGKLYSRIVEHEDDLREIYPNFNPDGLHEQLELIGEVLHQKDEYMKDVTSPKKKGLFRRAWDNVKGFAKRHPIVTVLLVAAGLTAAVAGGFYIAANWELIMANVGVSKVMGGVEAAGEMMNPTAPTNILPGGGINIVPPPAAPIPGAEFPI